VNTVLAQSLVLIFLVESNRGANMKEGDHDSVGPFQERKIFVDDVNRILALQKNPKRYTYNDRMDFEKARQMAEIYLTHWGAKAERRLHRKLTWQDYAGLFNAGYEGYFKGYHLAYLAKIVEKYYKLAQTDALRELVKI
jgi:hypothetical protein